MYLYAGDIGLIPIGLKTTAWASRTSTQLANPSTAIKTPTAVARSAVFEGKVLFHMAQLLDDFMAIKPVAWRLARPSAAGDL